MRESVAADCFILRFAGAAGCCKEGNEDHGKCGLHGSPAASRGCSRDGRTDKMLRPRRSNKVLVRLTTGRVLLSPISADPPALKQVIDYELSSLPSQAGPCIGRCNGA